MSTVSGLSSSSALSWIKRTQATAASSSTSSTSSTPSTQSPGGDFQSKIDTALSDQGITGTKLSDLRTQIQDAVDKVKAGSDGTSDNRDAVKSAVDGVLKDAGVDIDQFQSEMKVKGGRGGPHGAGGPKGPPPGDAASSSDSNADDDSSTATGSASSTTASSFDAYLKSSGIDPDQFKNSIIASLQSGSTDFSSAFSGASVGSSVDFVA